eukprot:5256852-Amphidinium_carterae.1
MSFPRALGHSFVKWGISPYEVSVALAHPKEHGTFITAATDGASPFMLHVALSQSVVTSEETELQCCCNSEYTFW